jgi:hypothetical protein
VQEGNFWLVPSVETHATIVNLFNPTEENELEPVPVRYIYMLDVPF